MPITGGCLCGNVRYAVSSAPEAVYLCYCHQCQKAQGTPFVASVPVVAADFQITHGSGVLKAYRSSTHKSRYFCGDCGSPVYSHVAGGPTVRIRAGSFDDAQALKITAHIYTADKTGWYEIGDDNPQYPAREPGRA